MSTVDDTYQAVRDLAHFEAHHAVADLKAQAIQDGGSLAIPVEALLVAVFMSGFHQAVALGVRHPAVLTRYAVALAVVSDMDAADQADLDSNADHLAALSSAGLN